MLLFLIVDVELRDEKGIVALEEVFVLIQQTVEVVVAADELYVIDLEVDAIEEP